MDVKAAGTVIDGDRGGLGVQQGTDANLPALAVKRSSDAAGASGARSRRGPLSSRNDRNTRNTGRG